MLSPAPLQDRLQAQRECLGSKVPAVAEKRDPTVGQTSFHRIFQMVRNLALPPWPARVQGWWPELSPTAKTRLA